MPRTSDDIFIWIPRKYLTNYEVLIKGTDRRKDVLRGEFSKALSPDMGEFNLLLDNNNQAYNGVFGAGDAVQFNYDFDDGTTRRFLGDIEQVKDVFSDGGQQLKISGSHVSGQLLDRTVIAVYDGSVSAADIIKDLITNFAPSGFTTAGVEASLNFPKISFNAVPLWQAMGEIRDLQSDFDLYVDDAKDVQFFKEGSRNNDDEAVVLGDTLITLDSLGTDSLLVRNKVRVYGESDGLPVIFTANNESSQTEFTVKERVIKNTDITKESEAESLANAVLNVEKGQFDIGGGLSLMLATLNPGDFVYISSTLHNILGRFRFVRFTHRIPDEMTDFEVEDVRS